MRSRVRYLRRAPLGRPLRAPAHVERREGVKTGHLADEHGVTVETEGVFIHPKQALA